MASAMRAVRKLNVRYYAWDDSASWAKELIRRMRTSSAIDANPKLDFSVTQLKTPTMASSQFVFGAPRHNTHTLYLLLVKVWHGWFLLLLLGFARSRLALGWFFFGFTADGSSMEFSARQPITEVMQSVYARAEDFLE
jgi:hypothetical protein